MNKKIARWSFVIITIITLFFGYFIKDLKFNYVFEDFFPVNDPELAYYQEFKKDFNNDNDYLLISVINTPSIFKKDFLTQIDSLTNSLESIPNVTKVNSLTNTNKPVIGLFGVFNVPLISINEPEDYVKDSAQIYNNPLFVSSIVSEDGKATAIILQHDFLTSKEKADQLVTDVESILASFRFDKSYIAGKIYAQGIFISKMKNELLMFLSASIVLVIMFLAFAYRNWWGVFIPLVVILIATIWVMGLMGLVGKSLDILMVLLPTIMFVVGMSDVVHIMTKYIEQLRLGNTKVDALKITIREIGTATFLTSLTTAVGFATLMTASINPIKEFGLYTAIGVFFAFIVAFSILPSCLIFLKKPKISKIVKHRTAWAGNLSKLFILTLRNGKVITMAAITLTVIAAYGLSQIVVNTYLIEDMPNDAPLKQSFSFFDQQFGGSRPFDISLELENNLSLYEPSVLKEIQKVENYLKTDFEAGNIISPVTIVKGLNQALNGGGPEAFALPSNDKDWKRVKKYLNKVQNQTLIQKVTVKKNSRKARITARVGDIGSNLSLKRTEKLRTFIAENTDENTVKFIVTGTSNLIDKNNAYLAKNMFQGIAIAFVVVAIIAGFLFRSIRMMLITLVPNIIPLVLIAGVMGYFGITLKLSTSIIFTIAFGIAVDDTLHMISKLRIELNKGKSLLYALKRTYLSTGKAIIITSLILSAGFLTLLMSTFGGTFYVGLLVGLTLVFALLIDLTLLPVLILYFYKTTNKNKR